MNKYRTHNCNELRKDDLDKDIFISGWINKKRDHGNLLFIHPDIEIFLSKSSFLNSLQLCVLYLFNYSPKASFIILKSIGFFRFKLILSILYMKSKILP